MALGETAKLVVELSLRDKMARGLLDAQKNVKNFDKAFSNTQRSLSTTVGNIERATVGVALAGGGLLVAAVKTAADFESSLNTINTIAREDAVGLKGIGDQIRGIARTTGTPLEELTQGYYDLLSAGIDAADSQNVLTAANRLAIGGLASTAETVDLLTTAINTYGGDASKAAEYADQFAVSVERGKVTAAEIAASFANIGPIAAASGLEIGEIAAAYARLTASGVPAAEATTQMRSAVVALTKVTGPLEDLQKQTGKTYLEIAGKKGLVVALEEMRKDAEKAGVPLVDLLGRVEGLNFTLATTGPNFDAYQQDLLAVGDASGTAAEQMAERQQGLNFQLGRLKALATDAGITIGSKLLPKLTPLAEKLVALVDANPEKIEEFGDKIATFFDKFVEGAGKVDWNAIGGGLQIAAQGTKMLVDAFNALPPDVQKLAIAALAVNKLTGGLPTSLVKDFAGLALRSLTTIQAANVTVVGGSVTGGGGVGGAVGGAGKIATLASIASKVFIVGAAAGVAAQLWGVKEEQTKANLQQGNDLGIQTSAFAFDSSRSEIVNALEGIREQQERLNNELTPEGIAYQLNIDGVRTRLDSVVETLETKLSVLNAEANTQQILTHAQTERLDSIKSQNTTQIATTAAVGAVMSAGLATTSAVLSGQLAAANARLDAIRAKRTSVTVNNTIHVSTSVSVKDMGEAVKQHAKYSHGSNAQIL